MSTTSTVQHTTPPWKAEPIPTEAYFDPDLQLDAESLFWIVDEREGEVLATVHTTSAGNAEANAHVLGAAADLLAALKRFVDDGVFDEWPEDQQAYFRGVIAKAEGR